MRYDTAMYGQGRSAPQAPRYPPNQQPRHAAVPMELDYAGQRQNFQQRRPPAQNQ